MKLAYYPGCSLHGMAKEYDISTRAVCEELGMELEEVPDWNCCGATSAHSFDRELSLLLPARNLKIVEQQNLDVIIPCAACFSRTRACADAIENDDEARKKIEKRLNFSFAGKTKIYHLMEMLVNEIGLDKIREHVKTPLRGLRVVCYYGCLLVRPEAITNIDDMENPVLLDNLMETIGAQPVDWSYKTECCGASLSLSRADMVTKLVSNMIDWAQESGAQAIVTACPLCQANMEMRQGKGQNMPVFYFTELLGLAFGLGEIKDCLKSHLIEAEEVINSLGNMA